MEVEVPGTSSAWQAPKPLIGYGTPPDLAPSDDKMVDVWLALHGDKILIQQEGSTWTQNTRSAKEDDLYDLLTKLLIERAKNYGSLERR